MAVEAEIRQRLTLLRVLDLAGTFVFAVEGALAGAGADLDVFGIAVLAIITSTGGGVMRDVLIGATPPAALRDWRYVATALAGAALVVVLHAVLIGEMPSGVLIALDAGGLSLFAVAGTEKALDAGLNPLIACPLGAITGIGGGTIRDVLLNEVPAVLHANFYASAALAGTIVLVIARRLHAPPWLAAVLGAAACFTLRIVSVPLNWNLPHLD